MSFDVFPLSEPASIAPRESGAVFAAFSGGDAQVTMFVPSADERDASTMRLFGRSYHLTLPDTAPIYCVEHDIDASHIQFRSKLDRVVNELWNRGRDLHYFTDDPYSETRHLRVLPEEHRLIAEGNYGTHVLSKETELCNMLGDMRHGASPYDI